MKIPTDEEKAVQQASYRWPKSGPQQQGRRVACPNCGQTGYPGGRWTWAHSSHTEAPCGKKYVTGRYLQHRVHCDTCRALPK